MNRSKRFAFLGDSFKRFIVLIVIAIVGFITEKVLTYQYVILQKNVQEGAVYENWRAYMVLGGIIILVSLILVVIRCFFVLWVEKIQKINFFTVYNGIIQEDGKLEGALKDFMSASAKTYCVIETVITVINSAYIVVLMGVVSLSVPEYIGAIAILACGIVFGILRGKIQAKTDLLGAETQSLQQKLSNFFMISPNVLHERLRDIEKNYWRRTVLQCIKNAIQVLPDVVKVLFLIVLFYNIVDTGMAEGKIYPYTYVVLTAYGYVVTLAGNISNLIEYSAKIVLYNKDEDLRELKEEVIKREKEIAENSKFVKLVDGVTIEKGFTAALIRPNGEKAHYQIPMDITLKKGTVVMLEGENGTGKSRFSKLVREIVPGSIGYDTKTAIVEKYHENLTRGKTTIDFKLVSYLAKGLMIDRIPTTQKEFMELNCSRINSADRQMLVALQILYFAIKEQGTQTQLVILDEIFGNLSPERTEKVVPFIVSELNKIGACTIIVSHSHKELIKKYISAIWQMYNKENEVIIEEKPV